MKLANSVTTLLRDRIKSTKIALIFYLPFIYVVISNIRIKVRIPSPVDILPILFDFVQPAREIIVIKDKTPRKKEIVPKSLGSAKSRSAT
jgi:hypothetical protein